MQQQLHFYMTEMPPDKKPRSDARFHCGIYWIIFWGRAGGLTFSLKFDRVEMMDY